VIGAGSEKVTDEWQIANERRSVARMIRKVQRSGGKSVALCYEAGPCGYALQRQCEELGVSCSIVAPSLIPVKPGERVKTDRRDSRKLAELFRAGLLTEVRPPSREEEAVRDLTRAREDAKRDLMSARHRLSKMLLRHGLHFREGTNWTQKHRAWLRTVNFDIPVLQDVMANYLLSIEQIEERLKMLEQQIEALSTSECYAERVGWLRCLRGIDTLTAMIILTELHNPCRFNSARELMAYLGLTPREYSSGGRQQRGSITKTGNAHVRRVLVETAWNYRHRPSVSAYARRRRDGQPPAIIAIADRAQLRLHKRYCKLKDGYSKNPNVATVAVARELAGFIWAVLNYQEAA